jgi:hypothetical protein
MALAQQIENFRGNILEGGVLDSEGVHHEFNAGGHGRKLDFDLIPTYADASEESFSPLYGDWLTVTTGFIQSEFPDLPRIVLGVANGTNRVAEDVAILLSEDSSKRIRGYATVKDEKNEKVLWLPDEVEDKITKTAPELVVVIEDVGTTGSQSVQIAQQAIGAGAEKVIVVPTWQRQERLVRLDEARIEYRAIIKEPLPTFSPEDCVKTGFCAQGWEFIPREK